MCGCKSHSEPIHVCLYIIYYVFGFLNRPVVGLTPLTSWSMSSEVDSILYIYYLCICYCICVSHFERNAHRPFMCFDGYIIISCVYCPVVVLGYAIACRNVGSICLVEATSVMSRK